MGKASRPGIPKHASDLGERADAIDPERERGEIGRRERELDDDAEQQRQRHGNRRATASAEALSRIGYSAPMVHESLRDDNGMSDDDTASKIHASWAGSRQPLRPPGRFAEPAGNDPVATSASELASGHVLRPAVAGVQGLDYHVTEPRGEVAITWHAQPMTDAASPMHSALRQHVTGQARVTELDQAAASAPYLREQLGDRAPMGIQGAQRDMPTGSASISPGGATAPAPGPTPGRRQGDGTANGAIVAALDRDRARGFHPPPAVSAPGREYTSRVPGEDR